MADPSSHRFQHVWRGIGQTRYCFVHQKDLQTEPNLSFPQRLLSAGFRDCGIRLNQWGEQPLSYPFHQKRHLGVNGITNQNFTSLQTSLQTSVALLQSPRLPFEPSHLLGLAHWISLEQYVLVAGDTS